MWEPKDEEKSRLNSAVFILDFLELLITFHGAKWRAIPTVDRKVLLEELVVQW
jgi:hypothetical protein